MILMEQSMRTMRKQFQGSKKKARKKAYFERETKRAGKRFDRLMYDKAMKSGNIEEMAKAMGVKLK
jgi:hypothetical protein